MPRDLFHVTADRYAILDRRSCPTRRCGESGQGLSQAEFGPSSLQKTLLGSADLRRYAGVNETPTRGQKLPACLGRKPRASHQRSNHEAFRTQSAQGYRRRYRRGAVNGIVKIEVAPGVVVSSSITKASIQELGLSVGDTAYAVIKASSVMVGIDD